MKPRASAPRTMSGLRGLRPLRQLVDRLLQRLGFASSGMMSLKTIPASGSPGRRGRRASQIDCATERSLTLGERRAAPARRAAGRAPAPASPSDWRSSRPLLRRSGLRERSAGATSCSSRPASRSAAVRKARRCRGAIPNRASCAQAAAISASRLAVEPLAALDARRRAGRTPRARARARRRSRRARRARRGRSPPRARRARPAGAACAPRRRRRASSWRITRSGRNSSRCRRRIVSAARRPPR